MHQIKVESVTISMKTNCSHVSKYRSLCSVTLSQITARLPSQSVISGLPGVCMALSSAHKPVTCSVGVIIGMKSCYGQLKGKCSDWLWGFLFYTLSGFSILLNSLRFFFSPPQLFFFCLVLWICCHGGLTILLTPLSENEFFHPALDWLHLWGVTLSENASLLLIQSSFLRLV